MHSSIAGEADTGDVAHDRGQFRGTPIATKLVLFHSRMDRPVPNLSAEQIGQIRSLRTLRRLHISGMDAALLQQLVPRAEDPPSELRNIVPPWNASQALCDLLPNFPAMDRLRLNQVHVGNFDFMGRLVNLQHVYLHLSQCSATAQSLADALQHCTQITTLQLCSSHWRANALSSIVSPLSRLRSLCLWGFHALDSLSFLSEGAASEGQPGHGLSASLTELSLRDGGGRIVMTDEELRHLMVLRKIRRLDLQGLASYQDAIRMIPRSQVWPELQSLTFD
jgi:hypothetical protein